MGELQFVLELEEGETLPTHSFVGPTQYCGKVLELPLSVNLLANGKLPGFVQDTDPLQYGMVVYKANFTVLTYSAITSSDKNLIKYYIIIICLIIYIKIQIKF